MRSVKSQILSAFSAYGFSLRSDATKYLESRLGGFEEAQISALLKKIIDYVQSQSLSSALIETSSLVSAVEYLENSGSNENITFHVVDAFSLKAYIYHKDTKKFISKSLLCPNTNLHGKPEAKADIYTERYKVIHQRTARHKLFAPPAITGGSCSAAETFSLKSVEYLLGASAKQTGIIVLGMLTQLKEGQFHLEDPTGCVPLNLSQASYKGGLFTENTVVLAEGWYEDGTFHVMAIGFPPPEPASITLTHFPNFDPFPGDQSKSFRLSAQLKTAEERNSNAMIVFLSDVWLDQLKIMEKLRVLFSGYSDVCPTCFVLIGNFLSLPKGASHGKIFKECFEKLATLIGEFQNMANESYFVFVPGPDDPGLQYILPRPPIPDIFLSDFRKKVPKAIFTSNPCRIQFCSQEIVIFREDIVSKMCRNSIYMPWEHEKKVDIPSLFVKTLIANSHLMPLPLNVAPIYWEYEHAFWLYPLPDVVVCADKYDPYTISSTDCIFFNPGSVPRTDFSFKVYIPADKLVEDSQIPDDITY